MARCRELSSREHSYFQTCIPLHLNQFALDAFFKSRVSFSGERYEREGVKRQSYTKLTRH